MDVEIATNFGDESVVAVGTSFPAQEGTALPLDVLQPLSALGKVLQSLFQVNPSASHVGKSGIGDDSSKVASVPVSSGLVPTQLNTQPLKVSTTPK